MRVVQREMDPAWGMSGEGHEAFGEHTDGVFATARLRAFAQVDALGGKGSVAAASGGTVASAAFPR